MERSLLGFRLVDRLFDPRVHVLRLPRAATVIVSALLLSAVLAAAALRICAKCGYENSEEAKQCRHCRAALVPDGEPEEPVPDDGRQELPEGPMAAGQAVLEEIRLARSHLDKGDLEIARLLFRNAAAIAILCERPPPDANAGELLRQIRKCEEGRVWVRRDCPVCKGAGKVPLRGASSLPSVAGRRCPHCGGRAFVRSRATVDETKFLMGRARRAYTALQRGRGLTALGNAWIPPGLAEDLAIEERVRVMQMLADPCPECMGLGQTDCGQCKGRGVEDCPAKGCDNGKITSEVKGGIIKKPLRRTDKCKTCGGMGVVACEKCRGKGRLLCQECGGTGERPACGDCNGKGIVDCRKCSGTGVYKGAECAACDGKGHGLCDDCGGDGRER